MGPVTFVLLVVDQDRALVPDPQHEVAVGRHVGVESHQRGIDALGSATRQRRRDRADRRRRRRPGPSGARVGHRPPRRSTSCRPRQRWPSPRRTPWPRRAVPGADRRARTPPWPTRWRASGTGRRPRRRRTRCRSVGLSFCVWFRARPLLVGRVPLSRGPDGPHRAVRPTGPGSGDGLRPPGRDRPSPGRVRRTAVPAPPVPRRRASTPVANPPIRWVAR